MHYEDKLVARLIFLGSVYVASAGPFFLYWMYCLWLVFDYLLLDHSRSHLYIFFKVFFAFAYSATSTWYISDLLPRVYEFWNLLHEESQPDPLERPTEDSDDFIF